MAKRFPPLPVLQAFETACRLGSFSAAANELNVTRSAISHRISLLEDLLGGPVFERDTRNIILTPTGAAYLPRVSKALVALDDVAKPIVAGPRVQHIRLSMPPTIARMVVLPRLKPFLDRHPEIEIALELSQSQLDYRTHDTDIDIRFGTGRHPGKECRRFSDDLVFPVASPDYAERHKLETPADLDRAKLLRSRLEPWKPWFNAAGLPDRSEPERGHRFEDLALAYHAAALGMGVALARAALARNLLASGNLVRLFETEAHSPHAYYVVYDSGVMERPACAALLAWLLAEDADIAA